MRSGERRREPQHLTEGGGDRRAGDRRQSERIRAARVKKGGTILLGRGWGAGRGLSLPTARRIFGAEEPSARARGVRPTLATPVRRSAAGGRRKGESPPRRVSCCDREHTSNCWCV